MNSDTAKQQEQTNGQSNGADRGRPQIHRETYHQKSATFFETGRVCTFIYANLTPWGEVEFRVEQARKGLNGQLTDQFRSEDVQDMIRGAYKASQWIKKRQRAYRWKILVAAL